FHSGHEAHRNAVRRIVHKITPEYDKFKPTHRQVSPAGHRNFSRYGNTRVWHSDRQLFEFSQLSIGDNISTILSRNGNIGRAPAMDFIGSSCRPSIGSWR